MRYTGDTGAASAAWMLAASCGETVSSASRQSTQSCRAWSTAYCFWRPKPSHSFCTRRAPKRLAISAVPSLLPESTTTISSAKARLSRQGARTAAALRVMRTAESGARGAAFKGYPVKSAGPILNNNDAHSLRENIVFGRRGAELPGGERRGANAAGRAHRLGGRRALRRHRGDACLGAPGHSRGIAPLAQGPVEPGGVGRVARVPASAHRRALRRGDQLAGAHEARGDVVLGTGHQARPGRRERPRRAHPRRGSEGHRAAAHGARGARSALCPRARRDRPRHRAHAPRGGAGGADGRHLLRLRSGAQRTVRRAAGEKRRRAGAGARSLRSAQAVRMRKLYTALLRLALPLILLLLWWRGRRARAYRDGVPERLGHYSLDAPPKLLWVHAVSVGEARAAAPLVRALTQALPDHHVL